MSGVRNRRFDDAMPKKALIPPRHRPYPRAHPTPVRPSPAPPPRPIVSWLRSVPEGRSFPRT